MLYTHIIATDSDSAYSSVKINGSLFMLHYFENCLTFSYEEKVTHNFGCSSPACSMSITEVLEIWLLNLTKVYKVVGDNLTPGWATVGGSS